MKIYREQAKQAHPVPTRVTAPRGPFPAHLFEESEIVDDYMPAMAEDGAEVPLGATAQNNFKPIKWVYCSACFEKVKSTETAAHICEE